MKEPLAQPRFISNTSCNTIIATINEIFLQANRADFAVAYLSDGGWQLIRPMIMQRATNPERKLRLLVRHTKLLRGHDQKWINKEDR